MTRVSLDRCLLALALGLSLSGCGSVREDMELLCNAESRWEADAKPGPAMDPGQRPRMAFQWAIERMKTSEGRRTAEVIAGMSGPTQAEALRKDAAGQGIASCPFADTLDARSDRKAAPRP